MSDPVTNADIEDILASIRRLVVEGPPRPGAPGGVAGSGPVGAGLRPDAPSRGRLVLTSAHRIEGEEEAVAPPLVLSAPVRADRPAPRASEAMEIEVTLGAGAAPWEPDGSEALDWSLGAALLDDMDGPDPASPPPVAELPAFRHHEGAASQAPAADHAPGGDAGSDPPPQPHPIGDERLRALVAEVVRAELQAQLAGELGLRITRNLRKLVRREVFRVIETRDDP